MAITWYSIRISLELSRGGVHFTLALWGFLGGVGGVVVATSEQYMTVVQRVTDSPPLSALHVILPFFSFGFLSDGGAIWDFFSFFGKANVRVLDSMLKSAQTSRPTHLAYEQKLKYLVFRGFLSRFKNTFLKYSPLYRFSVFLPCNVCFPTRIKRGIESKNLEKQIFVFSVSTHLSLPSYTQNYKEKPVIPSRITDIITYARSAIWFPNFHVSFQ